MKGSVAGSSVEWFQFNDPDDEEQAWRVNVGFMMSNWRCIYGQGCTGFFGTQDEHTFPEMGCCGHGAYINSKEELQKLEGLVAQLTEEDLGPTALAYIRKNGWYVTFSERDRDDPENTDYLNAKTRERDGGCVMQNRSYEDSGKIGCAFVHLGNRLGRPDHIDNMPKVCWQLPLGSRSEVDESIGRVVTSIVPWDADYWGGADEDGTHDSWLSWWCIDTPDAYIGKEPLYVSMRRELVATMGEPSYEIMMKYLDGRKGTPVAPMPGSVVNEGRPLLPLIVGGRTPRGAKRH